MMKSQSPDRDPILDGIEERLKEISYHIAETCAACGRSREEIALMAVTKTVAPVYINHAVQVGGIRLLGENRAQELCEKYDDYLLKQKQIHFIGHLQTNKVRQIIDKVSLIQSVDSLKLAQEIDRLARKENRQMEILLEVNIGGEETKSGILPEHLFELAKEVSALEHLRIKGLMAIPPIGDCEVYFGRMEELFHRFREMSDVEAEILSLGMSGDYKTAIRYGSTMLRLGSAIFGPRNYGIK